MPLAMMVLRPTLVALTDPVDVMLGARGPSGPFVAVSGEQRAEASTVERAVEALITKLEVRRRAIS
jgi:hypothetical protein